MSHADPLVMALPKGRLLSAVLPQLEAAGIEPEADFADPASRKLWFTSNHPGLQLIRVRAFDVATLVAFGGAQLGIVGSDVLMEFDYAEIYAPLDLGLGRCRMAVAEAAELGRGDDPRRWSHVRVATKYPNITKRHFEKRGVQAECIRLSGALELAPKLGLCRRIVDLVETGATLKANGLVEVELIANISARLIVNRAAMKLRPRQIGRWVDALREAVDGD